MAFSAGDVETRLGFTIDDREARRYRQLVQALGGLRADAQLGGNVDDSAFREIDSLLSDVQGESAQAELSADVDRSGFREMEQEVNRADGSEATARLSATVDESGFRGFRATLTKTVGAAAAAGIAAGAAILGGVKDAIAEETDQDLLAAQLDLTAKESARYGKVAGGLYANAYGESLGEVDEALDGVLSSVRGMRKATDAELAEQTAHAIDFSKTFGIETERITQSVGTAIQSNLAETSEEAFDLITRASNKVPRQLREDLLDASDEYGQFFTSLGYGGEQTFGLLADAAAKGTFGIDKIGDAVKEFTIRSTDMSTSSTAAYKSIGLDANEMANAILAGGDKAEKATKQTIDGLLGIEDPAARANAAIALFGTPIEDLNVKDIPAFLESLRGTEDGLGRVEGAADRMGEHLNTNTAGRLETYKRKAAGVFKALGHEIVDSTEDGIGAAEKLGKKVRGPILEGLQSVVRDSKGELARFGRAFTDAKEFVGDALATVRKSIKKVFGGEGSADVREFAAAMRSGIGFVLDVLGRLVRLVTRIAKDVLPGMGQAFEGVLTIIRGVMKIITGLLTGDFGKVWDGLGDIAKGGLKALKGVLTAGLAPIKSAVGAIGDAVGDGVTAGFNAAGRAAASVVNAIIDVITKIPGVPDIAHVSWGGSGGSKRTVTNKTGTDSSRGAKVGSYFEGGKVTEPIAIMGEEAPQHPEWVIPTNPAYRNRAVGLWMAAAQELGIPGFAEGGLLAKVGGKVRDAAGTVAGTVIDAAKASPGGQLISSAADLIGDLPGNPGGLLKGTMSYVLDKAKTYIKDKVSDVLPDLGFGGGGGGADDGATVMFDGVRIAAWIAPLLAGARKAGWSGRVASGFRSLAEQTRLWNNRASNPYPVAAPGSSNHEGATYPRGAVDVSDSGGLVAALRRVSGGARLKWFGPGDAVHFSGTGHRMGGKRGTLDYGGERVEGTLATLGFRTGGKTTAKSKAQREVTRTRAQVAKAEKSAAKVDVRAGRAARDIGTIDDFDPVATLREEIMDRKKAGMERISAAKEKLEKLIGTSGAKGSAGDGNLDGSEVDAFDKAYPRKITSSPVKGMAVFTSEMVKKLAASVGLPARMFDLIAKGESGRAPGIQQPDPGDGMVGYGLWQNTPNAWGAGSKAMAKFKQLGGIASMFIPRKNALMAKFLYDNAASKTPGTKGFPWYGTQYLARGGRLAGRIANVGGEMLAGGVRAFKKGGKTVGRLAKGKVDPKILQAVGASTKNEGVARSVSRAEAGISGYERQIQNLEREYGQLDRAHSVEPLELLTENEDGSSTVNSAAVNKRLAQIDELAAKRAAIKAKIEEYRRQIQDLMTELRNAIERLQAAVKATPGKSRKKTRDGYKATIATYTERLGELGDTWGDLAYDARDADIDLSELAQERSVVAGTSGVAAPKADTKTDDATTADPSPADPSPEKIAKAAASQLQAFMDTRGQMLRDLGSNVGDAGFSGGRTALEVAAAGRQYGYAGQGTDAPSTTYNITQNYGGAPEQPDAWNALVRHSVPGAA